MTTPFNGEHPATAWTGSTLVHDGTFCLCAPSGDITPGGATGLFHEDERVLSQWELRIDGAAPEPLSVQPTEPFAGEFVARTGDLLVVRRRIVDAGLIEDIAVTNTGAVPAAATVTIRFAADHAALFAVKSGHPPGRDRSVDVKTDRPATITEDSITFQVTVEPRLTWRARVTVGDAPETGPDLFSDSTPARRTAIWRADAATFTAGDPALAATLRRSVSDLASLRIGDPTLPTIAAGSPWYLTLFGRDSLLTAWMALPLDPRLALGTLHALAREQGKATDPVSEEEPGRIPHEIRAGWGAGSPLAGRRAYYGTADATPLFVMLLGELYRWGFRAPDLIPAADRALEWIGAREFITYEPRGGLTNQGWKDSPDAVSFADGTLAEPPIALCEVQAYVYGAFRARAYIARVEGDTTATSWDGRARDFKGKFHDRFWTGDQLAFALDGDGRRVDAVTSNIAHCLWTGILDDPAAAIVADRILEPDLFTGWGIRTLSSRAIRYNPVSYHNGSVWPHDTAIAVAGLARYGFTEHAARVATGLLDAAPHFDSRLPEVFCGFDRAEFAAPVPYPSACSPQAWAAASPLLLVQALLGLDPEDPAIVRPAVPPALGTISIEGIRIGPRRVTVTA